MFARLLASQLKEQAQSYPIVTVMGPRQSGKTTLAREIFPNKPYVNLEALDTRELAQRDPRAFLARYPHGAIFDEVQHLPELLSYIQVLVDETNEKGLFILTGSHQPNLAAKVSQSLAGRTFLLRLLPMSLKELIKAGFSLSADEYLLKGGYPRIYKDSLIPSQAYSNYLQTYVERDIRQLINLKDLLVFQKFLKLCAGRIGQILNLDGLSCEVGVSAATLRNWISLLEASFIVFRLQPYFENFGKRVIKSPKLYFTDTGLACHLLEIETISQLSRDPLRGHLFENMVVLEVLKERFNQGLTPNCYFFRDSHGNEVDLIYKSGNSLVPIEIKSSETFHSSFLNSLQYFHKLTPSRTKNGYLIYGGNEEQILQEDKLLNFKSASLVVENLTEPPSL